MIRHLVLFTLALLTAFAHSSKKVDRAILEQKAAVAPFRQIAATISQADAAVGR